MGQIPTQMPGAILPGNSTVELRTFDVPTPGHGEVLVRTKSTTICGSDIRCIYHQHLGKGPEGYQSGMIAGHEPCGQIVQVRPRLPAVRGGRPGRRLPHLRVRAVQRLPPRLHDLLHQPLAPGVRLATPRRHGALHPGRGEGPRAAAGRAHVLGRRAGRVRLRHGLRGPRAGRGMRQRRRARHRPRPGRTRDRDAGEGDGRLAPRRHRRAARAARARPLALPLRRRAAGRTRQRRVGPGADRRARRRARLRLLGERGGPPHLHPGGAQVGSRRLHGRRGDGRLPALRGRHPRPEGGPRIVGDQRSGGWRSSSSGSCAGRSTRRA